MFDWERVFDWFAVAMIIGMIVYVMVVVYKENKKDAPMQEQRVEYTHEHEHSHKYMKAD